MRRIVFLCCFLTGLSGVATEMNLLRNPSFSATDRSGVPVGWKATPTSAGNWLPHPDKPGCQALQLFNREKDKSVWWSQEGVKLRAGGKYTLRVSVKAAAGASYVVYVERNKPSFKDFRITGTGDGKWRNDSLEFSFDQLPNPPYLVFRLKGVGEVLFADPVLTEKTGQLINGDFGAGLEGWKTSGTVKITGGMLEMSGDQAEKNPCAHQEMIILEPGQKYCLSYQVRGGRLHNFDSSGATWFRVRPEWDGKKTATGIEWRDCMGDTQSKRLIFTAPATPVTILCELKSPGQVFIDNLKLEKTTADTAEMTIRLEPPFAYRNAVFAGMDNPTVMRGVVTLDKSGVKRLRIELQHSGGGIAASCESAAQPGENHFELPTPAVGEYKLYACGIDVAGKIIAHCVEPFTHYPQGARQVSFDARNIMHIDDQPVFPLGVWGLHGQDSLEVKLENFHRTGFNLLIVDADPQLLELAARQQLMVMSRVPETLPAGHTQASKQWRITYAARLRAMAKYSALVGYFIADEPAWRGTTPEPLIDAYRFYRQVDPYRPVLLNEAPRGKIDDLRGWRDAFDIYGVDIYPIPYPNSHSDLPDKSPSSVGRYTEHCRQVVYDAKPVWMTLQGFSWDLFTHAPQPRYPTVAESRFMAYNAVIHGATGLLWWGINRGRENPEFLRELGITVRELQSMTAVLVASTVTPAGLKTTASGLEFIHKRLLGQNYYLVVNASASPVRASFTIDSGIAALNVLFENRRLTADSSGFIDTFVPYDVHIYSDVKTPPPPLRIPVQAGTGELRRYDESYRQASWIWFPGKWKTAGHRAFFRREFRLESVPARADIYIAADDAYRLYVNGKYVVDSGAFRGGYAKVGCYDVAALLRSGKNLLAIEAADGGTAPCGLLTTMVAGNRPLLFSDASFHASEKKEFGWETLDYDASSWKPAEVIGKFGVVPWGYTPRVTE